MPIPSSSAYTFGEYTVKLLSFFTCCTPFRSPICKTHPVVNSRSWIKLIKTTHVDINVHVIPKFFWWQRWSSCTFEFVVETLNETKFDISYICYIKVVSFAHLSIFRHPLSEAWQLWFWLVLLLSYITPRVSIHLKFSNTFSVYHNRHRLLIRQLVRIPRKMSLCRNLMLWNHDMSPDRVVVHSIEFAPVAVLHCVVIGPDRFVDSRD